MTLEEAATAEVKLSLSGYETQDQIGINSFYKSFQPEVVILI